MYLLWEQWHNGLLESQYCMRSQPWMSLFWVSKLRSIYGNNNNNIIGENRNVIHANYELLFDPSSCPALSLSFVPHNHFRLIFPTFQLTIARHYVTWLSYFFSPTPHLFPEIKQPSVYLSLTLLLASDAADVAIIVQQLLLPNVVKQ